MKDKIKASEITREMVRAAMERSDIANRWGNGLSTDDVLDLVRGWQGERPPQRQDAWLGIEGRLDAALAQVRRHLDALVDEGLVWKSERGRRGYRWAWITQEDRDKATVRKRHDARFRELAEAIAMRVGSERERALHDVEDHGPVTYSTYHDNEEQLDGHITVRMTYAEAARYRDWLYETEKCIELPPVSDEELRQLVVDHAGTLSVASWAIDALSGDQRARRRVAYWLYKRAVDAVEAAQNTSEEEVA